MRIYLLTALTGPPDSYFYTDTHSLVWDRKLGCWTRDSLEADFSTRYSLHAGSVVGDVYVGSTYLLLVGT